MFFWPFISKVNYWHTSTIQFVSFAFYLILHTSNLVSFLRTYHTPFFFTKCQLPRHISCAREDLNYPLCGGKKFMRVFLHKKWQGCHISELPFRNLLFQIWRCPKIHNCSWTRGKFDHLTFEHNVVVGFRAKHGIYLYWNTKLLRPRTKNSTKIAKRLITGILQLK